MFWLPSLFCISISQLGNISYIEENFSKFRVSFGLWLCLLEVISSSALGKLHYFSGQWSTSSFFSYRSCFTGIFKDFICTLFGVLSNQFWKLVYYIQNSVFQITNILILYWIDCDTWRWNEDKGFSTINQSNIVYFTVHKCMPKNLQDYLNLGNKVSYISQVKR